MNGLVRANTGKPKDKFHNFGKYRTHHLCLCKRTKKWRNRPWPEISYPFVNLWSELMPEHPVHNLKMTLQMLRYSKFRKHNNSVLIRYLVMPIKFSISPLLNWGFPRKNVPCADGSGSQVTARIKDENSYMVWWGDGLGFPILLPVFKLLLELRQLLAYRLQEFLQILLDHQLILLQEILIFTQSHFHLHIYMDDCLSITVPLLLKYASYTKHQKSYTCQNNYTMLGREVAFSEHKK